MHLVLVGDSFIRKGPWELLWLVQAHRPVFGVGKIGANQMWKVFRPAPYEIRRGTFLKV